MYQLETAYLIPLFFALDLAQLPVQLLLTVYVPSPFSRLFGCSGSLNVAAIVAEAADAAVTLTSVHAAATSIREILS